MNALTEDEEAEVTSTSEPSPPAYSPHTHGFPPTSHSLAVTNPFALKKTPGPAPPKGTLHTTAAALTSCVLRPSKLQPALPTPPNLTHQEPTPTPTPPPLSPTTTSEALHLPSDAEQPTEPPPAEPSKAEAEAAGSDSKAPDPEPTSTPDDPKKEDLTFNATPAGFVFGSNLDDRVENVRKGVSNGEGGSERTLPPSTTSDVAKRKWEWETPASVTTGEEDESNVMQTSCRLFAFDGENSNWVERGRGLLRLNDRKEENVIHSRLIIRTKGSLRVMLNTPVFPEMIVEKSEEKYIKISGREDGTSTVKLFLIQCSHSDTDTLNTALEWRVRELASAAASTAGTPATQDSKVTIHQGHFDGSPPKKQKLTQ